MASKSGAVALPHLRVDPAVLGHGRCGRAGALSADVDPHPDRMPVSRMKTPKNGKAKTIALSPPGARHPPVLSRPAPAPMASCSSASWATGSPHQPCPATGGWSTRAPAWTSTSTSPPNTSACTSSTGSASAAVPSRHRQAGQSAMWTPCCASMDTSISSRSPRSTRCMKNPRCRSGCRHPAIPRRS